MPDMFCADHGTGHVRQAVLSHPARPGSAPHYAAGRPNAHSEPAEAGRRQLPQPQRSWPNTGPTHCGCCPAPCSLVQHEWGQQPTARASCITNGCNQGKVPLSVHITSHTFKNRRLTRAEAPSEGRGRAPAASRLPACAARAGATASLNPSVRRMQAPTAVAPRGPSVQPQRAEPTLTANALRPGVGCPQAARELGPRTGPTHCNCCPAPCTLVQQGWGQQPTARAS